jgi:hypothetical protein
VTNTDIVQTDVATIDQAKLEAFVGQAVTDMSAAISGLLLHIGDRLSADSTYELPAEQAMVVAHEDSPVFLAGAFEAIASCHADHDVFVDAFRTGAGVAWHEHDERLFSGTVRLFRPGYAAHLVEEWLPALDGMVEKLNSGASVADVGCGLGASTIIMAQALVGHLRIVHAATMTKQPTAGRPIALTRFATGWRTSAS